MNPHPAHVPSGLAGSVISLISSAYPRVLRVAVGAGLLALLSACVATGPAQTADWPWPDGPYPDQDQGTSPNPTRLPPPSAEQPPVSNPPSSSRELAARSQVGQSLLVQAREQRVMGAYVDAAASLERAIGIDAQDPVLWWELARVRLEQNRLEDAETLSQRALEYAWPEDPVYAACWELIARARLLRGDQRGAAHAREQARSRS